MRLIYLGRLTSYHAQNTLLAFTEAGHEVLALNTAWGLTADYQPWPGASVPVVNTFDGLLEPNRWYFRQRLLGRLLGHPGYRHLFSPAARQAIERFQPDLVYASWGSNDLDEISAILRNFPGLPVVHSVQCFPIADRRGVGSPSPARLFGARDRQTTNLALSRLRARLLLAAELRAYGAVIVQLAGRIDCSQPMRRYLERRYPVTHQPSLLWMERYSRHYSARDRLPLLSTQDGEPHVVFLGRTDFSNDPVDDIRPQLMEAARAGIHVHLADSEELWPDDSHIHRFKSWNPRQLLDGSLATFCTQFDACVVWYNVGPGNARFENTLPSRFLFAFPIGIPVVLPAGVFTGIEEVVRELDIGFSYRSISALYQVLHDRSHLATLRDRAIAVMRQETFEARWAELDRFLHDALRKRNAGAN